MVGLKHKLAHKRADRESWSDSDRAQRRRLIRFLREMLLQLESEEPAPRKKAAARR